MKSQKNVVKQFINILENNTKWYVPLPTKTLVPRKAPNYKPVHEDDLGQSVLITHYQRWSGNRHPKDKSLPLSRSVMPGLDRNLFASILASPMRADKITNALLPGDLLIQLGLINPPHGEEKGVITPLLSTKAYPGRKAYVYCNSKAFDTLSSGVWRKIDALLRIRNQSGILSHPDLVGSYEWQEGNVDFYKYLLFEGIKDIAWKLAGAAVKREERIKERLQDGEELTPPKPLGPLKYFLSWDTVCIKSIEQAGDSLTFNVPLILGVDRALQLKEMYDPPYIPPSKNGLRLMKLLWKYHLFCSCEPFAYSAYKSVVHGE